MNTPTYIAIAFERILIAYFVLRECLIRIGTRTFLSHSLESVLVPPGLRFTYLDPPGYPSLHCVYIRGVLVRMGTEKHHTVLMHYSQR